ncbi:MAG TPA: EAL domain-containing protein [Candidatus Competibacteraceae bacterium]|nr:EAL domain-containing protein [Candidatus Competibacteraceae bacterium]
MTAPFVDLHYECDPPGVILILEDKPYILAALYRQLPHEFHVVTATTVDQVLVLLNQRTVDVIVIGQRMAGVGIELLSEVRQHAPNTVWILLANCPALDTAIQASNLECIDAYLVRPLGLLELHTLLHEGIQEARLLIKNQQLLSELSQVKQQLEIQINQLKQELRNSQEQFQSVVRKNQAGILLLDEQGKILFANLAAETQLGRNDQMLIGSDFGIPVLHDKMEITILLPNRTQGIAELMATETQWQGQNAYLVMLHDVTRHKKAEAQARHLASHDSLTALPNRVLFTDRLNQALLRAQRSKTKAAVLFIDLNHFKEINDTLGHKVGDHLLQQFASRLAEAVRKSDTVARMGGDEFTVLLEGLNDRKQVSAFAKKLQKLFKQPFAMDNGELFAIPSIGISIYPDDAGNTDELLCRADSAMYYAKRHKEVDFCFYSKELDTHNLNRLSLEHDLRRALERQEFVLYYQIQVRLCDERPIGTEALVRWQHPSRGVVLPNDFIPLLEDTGLIIPVGNWILAEVCRQIAAWRAMDVDLVPVAVNISPKQLADKSFIGTMRGLLEHSNMQPRLLRLELTESAVMQDQSYIFQTLDALRELGIELHMDDFGVGYSSLGLLKQLPFDIVKVDQSFIVDVLTDSSSALLTQSIINIAHGLKKQVIAEGVETTEQAAYLLHIGCDHAQGWRYGQPIPAASMTDYLQNMECLNASASEED